MPEFILLSEDDERDNETQKQSKIDLKWLKHLQQLFKNGVVKAIYESTISPSEAQIKSICFKQVVDFIFNSTLKDIYKIVTNDLLLCNVPGKFYEVKSRFPCITFFMLSRRLPSNGARICYLTVSELKDQFINIKMEFTGNSAKFYFSIALHPELYFSDKTISIMV